MRTLIDTCVIYDWVMDEQSLNDGVWDILDDPENRIYISAESIRELIVAYNNKKVLSKYWPTKEEMLRVIEEEYGMEILPVTRNVVATYTRLRLNEEMNHNDPSDHIIIAHAITEHLTLLSSDTKFSFYRSQGLDLIEY